MRMIGYCHTLNGSVGCGIPANLKTIVIILENVLQITTWNLKFSHSGNKICIPSFP